MRQRQNPGFSVSLPDPCLHLDRINAFCLSVGLSVCLSVCLESITVVLQRAVGAVAREPSGSLLDGKVQKS